ncbi:hypothetical protein HOE67_04205 [Candidatus Peregrinibacteria bacterium]|jgi:hypothetical protein|nr:hypothetical protein [Candidatus Peregrinibacteria bacterium]MBT4056286.1 hypothetical protein [Candidatus Peregrinibacteria bacterium]
MKILKNNAVLAGIMGGAVLVILLMVWVFVFGVKAGKLGAFYNQDHNAIWIGHDWAESEKSDAEIFGLVDKLSRHDIDTIYIHSGPLNSEGGIAPAKYAATVNFVEKVKFARSDMKVLAWLGQLRHKINLGNPDIRRAIVSTCLIFTEMVGMDGVHYDIEPVWDEDEDFIKLLAETREVFDSRLDNDGRKRILSVALAEFIPDSFIWLTNEVTGFENYNTEVNYLNVAKESDQIVDMVYDTGIDYDYLYKWFVKEQVIWVTSLLGGASDEDVAGTEFFVGVPSYDEGGEGFDPDVENVGNAMTGIINGLNDIRSEEDFFTGIALYAEWETDDAEWAIIDALWN